MIRACLVPTELATSYRGPKYFPFRGDADAPALIQTSAEKLDYGKEPLILLAADLSTADAASLAAQPDVMMFAEDLDTPLGAGLATAQAALEARNLPAEMLTDTTTHRQVLRGIIGILRVAQCMQGKGFRVFGSGITLATTLSTLAVPARQALQSCASELGYDQTGITLASTIREVLAKIVQQAIPSLIKGVRV